MLPGTAATGSVAMATAPGFEPERSAASAMGTGGPVKLKVSGAPGSPVRMVMGNVAGLGPPVKVTVRVNWMTVPQGTDAPTMNVYGVRLLPEALTASLL